MYANRNARFIGKNETIIKVYCGFEILLELDIKVSGLLRYYEILKVYVLCVSVRWAWDTL